MKLFAFKSLKIKILVPVLSIALLGFLIMAGGMYLKSYSTIENEIRTLSETQAQKLAGMVDGFLEQWKSQIELIAAADTLKQMDFSSFKAYVQQRQETLSGYEMFYLADRNGNFKATIGSDGNISDREYFQRAIQGEVVVSDPVVSKATGKLVVVIVAPVKDQGGKILGLVGATMELTEISKQINTESFLNTGYGYMIDSKGIVVAHPNEEMLGTKVLERPEKSLVEITETMLEGNSGTGEYIYAGEKKLVGYAPVKSAGWSIALTASYREVMRDLIELRLIALIVGPLAILFIFTITIFVIGRSLKPVKQMVAATREITGGNLKVSVNVKSSDEIGALATNFNEMTENMRGLIEEMKMMGMSVAAASEQMSASSEEVSKGFEQVATAVSELAKGATEQAATTEKSSGQLIEIAEGLDAISQDMAMSEEKAKVARESVSQGEQAVRLQEEKMLEGKKASANVEVVVNLLSQKSVQIGQIIEVIREIAERTNLLSLNAAIEAARAGEQGRGFAVVADEIRGLAEQSKQSVVQIRELVKEVQADVEKTVGEINISRGVLVEQEAALNDTVKAFASISKVVSDIAESVHAVSALTMELSCNAKEVSDAVTNIASISQQTAAGTEEVAASTQEQTAIMQQISNSAEELSAMSNSLKVSIEQFTI